MRSAAPWLRGALFGSSMQFDVLFATWLVGCFARARMKGVLVWVLASGSPSHVLDTWLCRRGWTRDRPWVWRQRLTGESINFSRRRVVAGRLQHAVRNAWRAWCLLRHAATNRRDVDHVDCFVGGRLRVGYFRRIDGESIRKWDFSWPQARTICCGAAWSPASLACWSYRSSSFFGLHLGRLR